MRLALAGSLLAPLAGAPASAQAPPQPVPVAGIKQAQRLKLNQDTLIIAASRPSASYLAMADDLSEAAGAAGNIRVLPVAADGGVANLQDVLFLRGIDMAIVPANVLAYAKATNVFGKALPQRIAYVTVLPSEEVHIVAGQGIASIADLNGKRVAVPARDGTAQFTASDMLRRTGVTVDWVAMEAADALEEVRTGAVAAAVLVGGKPVAEVAGLPKDGSVRLLNLASQSLPGEGYAPAVLLPEDYPALIPPGAMVETVAVSAVLVTARGGDEAAHRVAKHTPAVLDAIAKLAVSQRHPKWKDVNLGAALPGWSRVEAAETWLGRASAQRREALQAHPEEPPRPGRRAKASEASAPLKRKLLEDFDAWARKSAASEAVAAQ